MAINEFKPFATGDSANVTSQSDWETLPALGTGFQSGKASSAQVNKALRQATAMGSAMGQFIANAGSDALDNGDIATLVTQFTQALTTSLGLGSAADLETVTSATDYSANRVVTTGWMGLGGGLNIGSDSEAITGQQLFDLLRTNYPGSCFIRCSYQSSDNTFAVDSPGIWIVGDDTCSYIQSDYRNGVVRALSGNMLGTLFENTLYGTVNPPPQQDLSGYITTSTAESSYIKAVQLGALTAISSPDDGSYRQFTGSAGTVLTALDIDESPSGTADNIAAVYYRPIQVYLNGIWTTINGG